MSVYIIRGPSLSGKTTIAKKLHDYLVFVNGTVYKIGDTNVVIIQAKNNHSANDIMNAPVLGDLSHIIIEGDISINVVKDIITVVEKYDKIYIFTIGCSADIAAKHTDKKIDMESLLEEYKRYSMEQYEIGYDKRIGAFIPNYKDNIQNAFDQIKKIIEREAV